MSTRCYKTKTEPTKGFCCFHQPRAWIPGRKARVGLQLPLPDGGSALQHGGCSSSHSWRCSEKHKTVEIPTSTETTSLFWTLMCFGLQPTQTSCSDVTQQCLASRKMPMAGGGACARAGGRAFGLSTGAPWPPLRPVWKCEPSEHWHPWEHPPQKIKIHTTGNEEPLSLTGRGIPTRQLKNQTKVLAKFQTLRWIHAGAQKKQDYHTSSPCLPQENPPLELGRKVKLVFLSYSLLWITPPRAHLCSSLGPSMRLSFRVEPENSLRGP